MSPEPGQRGSRRPSVSVVVPARNAAATIGDALESVARQTLAPLEVLVIDDRSTDSTAAVVEATLPEARRLSGAGSGPSGARNQGLAEARGDWVAFLDADDTWHERKLEDQVTAIARHPGAVMITSDWVRGTPTRQPSEVGETIFTHAEMLTLNRFQTSTVLARVEVLRELEGFDPALDGAEDWDMWLRASARGAIVKLDWPYVGYRDAASGYSKDTWRVYSRMLDMLDRERRAWTGRRADMDALVAWHHMRFAVAFFLARQPRRSREIWSRLVADGLRPAVPRATRRYLLPHLLGRAARRVNPRLARRLAVPGAPDHAV
ncbi:MAG: glycosyltransferase family 2 protein [Actinomycetota bacterium]|nr:glycosyltransferase family 2 protein [Actinomycetota bacterium]